MMTKNPPTKRSHKIHLFCVDDNPLVAQAINLTMKSPAWSEVMLAGCVESADALLDEARNEMWGNGRAPDIVLLDIDMPGKNVFDAITELVEICGTEQGKPRIILYSGLLEKRLVDRALESGAWGYVAKSDSSADLLAAIQEVMAGSFAFSPSVRNVM